MQAVTMPREWDDPRGWERFYSSLYPSGDYQDHATGFGSMGRHLNEFAAEIRALGWQAIWVPGCGLSPLARVLSGLGFDVHATDISPTAIEFQRSDANDALDCLPPESATERAGNFVCEVQDFKQSYLTEHFDVILNVKAFQGFAPEVMGGIARTHHAALKPGRRAYFDTMNVQGERRDVLERSLVEAGFTIPFFELTLWYRRTLRETNIPHVFVLGRPMVQKTGEYASDDEMWERDIDTLRGITSEYQTKARAEHEAWPGQRDRDSRLATVIYSTG